MKRFFRSLAFAGAIAAGFVGPALADGEINSLSNGTALTGVELMPMFQTANPAVNTTPAAISTYLQTLGIYVTLTGTQTLTNKTLTSPTLTTPALGTPASGNLANTTAFPLASLSGAGTGVLTALGVNIGSGGAPVLFGGAGGTPSSLTLTNATGLPIAGTTGYGTGVATALAIAPGTTGSFPTQDGAITTGHCLQWGPGIQDSTAVCGGSGTVTSVAAGCGTSTGGSPITTTGTVSAAVTRRANATTSDTIVNTDCGNVVSESNAGSIAVAIAQAGTTGFAAGAYFEVCNIGAGTATITPTTSTIGGASTLAIPGGAAAEPVCYAFQSDGTNYNLVEGPTVNAALLSSGVVAAARGGAGTVNGALKGNGSGTVSQAACADLSNGATGCSTATGTSGATLPFLNGTNTWSGTQTFSSVVGSINTQVGTTYTLQASDCGKTILITNASAITLTTLNSLPPGCAMAVEQGGAGQITVANGSGATLNSAHGYTKTFNAVGAIIGLFVDTGTGANAHFVLTGDGA